eukprot:gnl/TRDRNA2_/TRDRNA2_177779_c2_seq3.p1 gnl/TRDRNA2_/TRDRNA2_177779_c2~~gnl/TRDRNA2_/TRDRNA2_177779_c2_seq3.p1  ORF type:complete len:285 (-),score=-25.20 gnl/TRDRNA2_/TRDRNA2_177779_c2_seq3:906-1760(-)
MHCIFIKSFKGLKQELFAGPSTIIKTNDVKILTAKLQKLYECLNHKQKIRYSMIGVISTSVVNLLQLNRNDHLKLTSILIDHKQFLSLETAVIFAVNAQLIVLDDVEVDSSSIDDHIVTIFEMHHKMQRLGIQFHMIQAHNRLARLGYFLNHIPKWHLVHSYHPSESHLTAIFCSISHEHSITNIREHNKDFFGPGASISSEKPFSYGIKTFDCKNKKRKRIVRGININIKWWQKSYPVDLNLANIINTRARYFKIQKYLRILNDFIIFDLTRILSIIASRIFI